MSTANTIRFNYGVGKATPSLPVSYQLMSWYADPSSLAPRKLDITANGYFLDGAQIPLNGSQLSIFGHELDYDLFLNSWQQNTPNSGDSSTEELTLSFYAPTAPVGPFQWGTFEFEEDRSTLIGILSRKDAQGAAEICFVSGTRLATATPLAAPAHRLPPPQSQPIDISEMVTLTFPGLTQATCDAMNDDFSWAVDEQWRSTLLSKTRPDITAGLPEGAVQDRLAFLDANAEWFNAVFGPATLGMQLYQDSLPNAPNPVKLTNTLITGQVKAMNNFLNGPLGSMAQAQQEHLIAARTAHYKQNGRLMLYANQGQAFLNRLEQVNGDLPSIVTFLGVATMNPQFQNPAMRLTGRYAALLGALDLSGVLEQRLRTDIIGVTLLHLTNFADFTNQSDMQAVFTSLFTAILNDPAQSTNLLTVIKPAVDIAKGLEGLVYSVTACIVNAAATPGPKTQARVLGIASTASKAFDVKFPGLKLGTQAFLALCYGYSVAMAVEQYMNWANLTAEQRAQTIYGSVIQVWTGATITKTIAETIDNLGQPGAALDVKLAKLSGDIDAALDLAHSPAALMAKLKSLDLKVLQKANDWLSKFVKGETRAVTLIFEGFDVIAKFLAPVTAVAALAMSIYGLVTDIKSGAGALQIATDSVTVAVDTALVVCAAIDMVVDLAAVTVVGIVLAAIALVVTAVVAIIGWIFGQKKPISPPDDYMAAVVWPFEAMLPDSPEQTLPGSCYPALIRGTIHQAAAAA